MDHHFPHRVRDRLAICVEQRWALAAQASRFHFPFCPFRRFAHLSARPVQFPFFQKRSQSFLRQIYLGSDEFRRGLVKIRAKREAEPGDSARDSSPLARLRLTAYSTIRISWPRDISSGWINSLNPSGT